MGYFSLIHFAFLAAQGCYFLTRFRVGTCVYVEGEQVGLVALLRAQCRPHLDLEVEVGQKQRLACRLVAKQLPRAVAERRREQLRRETKKKGQVVSPHALLLAAWDIYLTNLPQVLASTPEVFILARLRWQIELLFKLWKSEARLDKSRSEKPWRILCECYAKLIGILVQHWICLTACWQHPDKSLVKAAQAVRRFASGLFWHLDDTPQLRAWLSRLCRVIEQACRMTRRGKQPHTYQLLLLSS